MDSLIKVEAVKIRGFLHVSTFLRRWKYFRILVLISPTLSVFVLIFCPQNQPEAIFDKLMI